MRVLLFGSGAAAGWGAEDARHGFGGAISAALHLATARPVVVDLLLEDNWEEHNVVAAVTAQRLRDYDAIVVINAYRPALRHISVDRWRGYAEALRDLALSQADPSTAIVVLSLPWRDAAARLPQVWGGAVGDHLVMLAEVVEEVVGEFRQIDSVTLNPPEAAAEWRRPEFSSGTYQCWGASVAVALLARLGEPADPSAAPDRSPSAGSTTPSISDTR